MSSKFATGSLAFDKGSVALSVAGQRNRWTGRLQSGRFEALRRGGRHWRRFHSARAAVISNDPSCMFTKVNQQLTYCSEAGEGPYA